MTVANDKSLFENVSNNGLILFFLLAHLIGTSIAAAFTLSGETFVGFLLIFIGLPGSYTASLDPSSAASFFLIVIGWLAYLFICFVAVLVRNENAKIVFALIFLIYLAMNVASCIELFG